jgi:hypothetical protein
MEVKKMTKIQAKKLKYLPKLLRAIRQRCLDCSAYNPHEVKLCEFEECSLFPYRMGKIDYNKKILRKKTQTKQKTPSQEEEESENGEQ